MNVELANWGNICAVLDAFVKFGDKGNWPFLVEAMDSLFGKNTEGP